MTKLREWPDFVAANLDSDCHNRHQKVGAFHRQTRPRTGEPEKHWLLFGLNSLSGENQQMTFFTDGNSR